MFVPIDEITEHLGIEKEEVIEFLHDFLDYSESEDLSGLEEALNTGDSSEVGRRGHSIKGAALNLKLTEVAELAGQIEKKGLANDMEEVPELTAKLKDKLKGIREFLKEH